MNFVRQTFAALLSACALAFAALPAWSAVDVNQATAADLQTVKGIGPSLSGKILTERKQGAFKNWDDLVDRVAGVGPGNAARFSDGGLTVAGASFRKAAAAKPQALDKAPAAATTPRPADKPKAAGTR